MIMQCQLFSYRTGGAAALVGGRKGWGFLKLSGH